MKRKLILSVVAALAAIMCFAASGCTDQNPGSNPSDHVHKYGEWQCETAATCGTDGLLVRTCDCGAKDYTLSPATGEHAFGEWTAEIAATCGADGLDIRTCSVCKATESRISNATGEHAFGQWKTETAATCLTEGSEKRVCSACGLPQTRATAKTDDHEFTWKTTKEATCAEKGMETGTCKICGATSERNTMTAPDNHTGEFSEYQVLTPATCVAKGTQFRYCLDCSKRLGAELPVDPDAHRFDDNADVTPATCTSEGSVSKVCLDCGKTVTKPLPIDPEAHKFVGIGDTPAVSTCVTPGSSRIRCEYCKTERETSSDINIYNHVNTEKIGAYTLCRDCKGLLGKQIDIVNGTDKYTDYYEVYLSGGFEVEFDFHSVAGSDPWWHNFIFDVAPATYLNGQLTKIHNGNDPMTPIIPGYNANHFAIFPFLSQLYESQSVATTWFKDEIEDTDFVTCVKKGVDVVATFVRESTGAVKATVVMTTENNSGLLRTCTLTATFGYHGVPELYIALTGENNTVNLKQVKVKKGALCAPKATEQSENLLSQSRRIENNTAKNVNGLNLTATAGDFDIELGFDIASKNMSQSWHNYLLYFFKGSNADTSIINQKGSAHYMTMCGRGVEPDQNALYHRGAGTWFAYTTGNVDTADYAARLNSANFRLRLTRKNGFITMLGTAYNNGEFVCNYRYFSSINSTDTFYNNGYYADDMTIRLSTENAVMTLSDIIVHGGSVKLQ